MSLQVNIVSMILMNVKKTSVTIGQPVTIRTVLSNVYAYHTSQAPTVRAMCASCLTGVITVEHAQKMAPVYVHLPILAIGVRLIYVMSWTATRGCVGMESVTVTLDQQVRIMIYI